MRLIIILYAGEYQEAWYRLAAGKESTWNGHKPTLDYLSKMADHEGEVIIFTCKSSVAYDEVLRPNLRVVGTGFRSPEGHYNEIVQHIARLAPTHLLIRVSERRLFRWAVAHKVPTLALLADSYRMKGVRTKIRNFLFARWLNHPSITWVSNHGINACQSLQKIGVNPDKIVPWDFEHTWSNLPPKTLRLFTPDTPLTLGYVGSIMVDKGIGDILNGVYHLQQQGVNCRARIAGKGNIPRFENRAQELGITDRVEFVGAIGHDQVLSFMREADLVIVPSRHEYPEGFPVTIYEALDSRTPLLVSDHPMFIHRLQHGVNAMMFQARHGEELALHIQTLINDPALYAALSIASEEAWQRLQLPAKWDQVIDHWLRGQAVDQAWFQTYRLTSGFYDDRLAPMAKL